MDDSIENTMAVQEETNDLNNDENSSVDHESDVVEEVISDEIVDIESSDEENQEDEEDCQITCQEAEDLSFTLYENEVAEHEDDSIESDESDKVAIDTTDEEESKDMEADGMDESSYDPHSMEIDRSDEHQEYFRSADEVNSKIISFISAEDVLMSDIVQTHINDMKRKISRLDSEVAQSKLEHVDEELNKQKILTDMIKLKGDSSRKDIVIRDLTDKLQNTTAQCKHYESIYNDIMTELMTLKISSRNKEEELHYEITRIKSEKDEMTNEISRYKTRLEIMQKEQIERNEEIYEKLLTTERKLNIKRRASELMEANWRDSKDQLSLADITIRELADAKNNAENRVKELQQAVEILEDKCSSLSSDVSIQTDKFGANQFQITPSYLQNLCGEDIHKIMPVKLLEELEIKSNVLMELEQRVNEVSNDLYKSNLLLNEYKNSDLHSIAEINKTLMARNEELFEQLKSLEANYRSVNIQYAALQKEHEGQIEHIKYMKNTVHELDEKVAYLSYNRDKSNTRMLFISQKCCEIRHKLQNSGIDEKTVDYILDDTNDACCGEIKPQEEYIAMANILSDMREKVDQIDRLSHSSAQREVVELRDKFNSCKNEFEDLKNYCERMTKTWESLWTNEVKLREKNTKIIEELQSEIHQKEDLIAYLKGPENFALINKEKHEAITKANELRDILDQREKEAKNIDLQLNEIKNKMSTTMLHNETLNASVKWERDKNTELRTSLNRINEEISKSRRTVTQLEAEILDKREKIRKLEYIQSHKEKEIEDLSRKLVTSDLAKDQLQTRLEDMTIDIQQMRSTWNLDLSNLITTINRNKIELDDLKKSHTKDLESSDKLLAAERERVAEKDKELRSCAEKIFTLTQEIINAKDKISEMDKTCKAQEFELRDNRNKLETIFESEKWRTSLSSGSESLSDRLIENQSSAPQIAPISGISSKLKAELSHYANTISELRMNIKSKEDKEVELKNLIEVWKCMAKGLETEVEVAQQDMKNTKLQLKWNENQVEQLRNTIMEREETYTKATEATLILQQQYEKKIGEIKIMNEKRSMEMNEYVLSMDIKLNELENNLEQKNKDLEDLQRDLHTLNVTYNYTVERHNTDIKKIENLINIEKLLNEELSRKEAEISEAVLIRDTKCAKLENEILIMENQLKNLKRKLEISVADRESLSNLTNLKLSKLGCVDDALHMRMTETNRIKEILELELEECKVEIQRNTTEINDLRIKNQELQIRYTKMMEENEELADKLLVAKNTFDVNKYAEFEALKLQLNLLKMEKQTLTEEKQSAGEALINEKMENAPLRLQLKELKNENENVTLERDQWQSECINMRKIKETLDVDLMNMRGLETELLAKLSKAKDESDERAKEIDNLNEILSSLRIDNDKRIDKCQETNNKLNELKKDYDELNEKYQSAVSQSQSHVNADVHKKLQVTVGRYYNMMKERTSERDALLNRIKKFEKTTDTSDMGCETDAPHYNNISVMESKILEHLKCLTYVATESQKAAMRLIISKGDKLFMKRPPQADKVDIFRRKFKRISTA